MKTALITGGGSGIGKELVKLFLRDNYRVLIFSLLQEELDQVASELGTGLQPGQLTLVQQDLSLANAAEQVYDYCITNNFEIDVLVNNAGFALWGEVVAQSTKIANTLMQLNIVALSELSHLFGKKMKEKGSGQILNIGSIMGISPVPLSAHYASSKAYVNAFSVALAHELRPHGVFVSCMEPNLTKTKFMSTSVSLSNSAMAAGKEIEEMEDKIAHSPTMVAELAYQGLKKKKMVIMPGRKFHLIAWLMRTLPQTFVANFIYKQASKNL